MSSDPTVLKTINIIDPGLNSTRGHHYDWNKKLADYYSGLGYSVVIYCNKQATIELLNSFDTIFPIFQGYPYRPVNSTSGDGKERPRSARMAQELYWFLRMQQMFQEEIKQVAAADYQLFTTLFDYQLIALANVPITGNIRAAIHFPPDQRGSLLGPALWASGFKMVADAQLSIRFLATTAEVAELYRSRYKQDLRLLPHIYNAQPIPSKVPSGHVTVGFLGEQRQAKGVALIPSLVDWLVAQGCHVICQDSSERLALANDMKGVEVLGYVDNLASLIARCDLVVTPYKPDWYRYNMAGIVVEALGCGVPVIAPAGSSPGNLVASLGAGVTFKAFSVESVIEALRTGLDNIDGLTQKARDAQLLFSRDHGVSNFASAFLVG